MVALFDHLPIPPSSNNQYILVRRGRKTYHVPSEELKTFKKEMASYAVFNRKAFEFNKGVVGAWVGEGCLLEVKAEMFFEHSRIFCKDGSPKKFDVSNRLKALHDQLALLLDIDDKWFFKVFASKSPVASQLNEKVVVQISHFTPPQLSAELHRASVAVGPA